ncbi:PQQ-dependent sugar dehydrogenase [Robertmurraya andreesenii]|uniref:Glucose/arabinose dehydrogenase n=1 Tax=Anoxybacillus andreesenii TaxID=1325932 RepID=A0ABT9V9B9_9BACL|nr:PQQ-dependent sugar dehydrogenase [Robertmurraya andreesenii]MDQ0157534.1 glucose/arabinose dehydrogenase [Robertmurraya andreesenii]
MERTKRIERKLKPEDILLPSGYRIEVFMVNLNTPINLTFTEQGEMLVADAGITTGNGKVLIVTPTETKVIAEGFNPPLTGITFYQGKIYVAHRGSITIVKPDGSKQDIITGLPSFGDHHNNRVIFGPDGKMYFGQGTATNTGVVGEDNRWLKEHPLGHDYPGSYIRLTGENFKTTNLLSETANTQIQTGAYSPFGVATYPGEMIRGMIRASGSILRANPDGSQLELVAWGLRNPFRMKFDRHNRLFCGNHGMDVRGSRPVENSPDEFQLIRQGMWYGWPDYTGGYPVNQPTFKPEGKPQPTFLLAQHPMQPPQPVVTFAPHSAIMGFDFNYDSSFAPLGEAFIAEFGSEAPTTTGGKPAPRVGHRISRIDTEARRVTTFAINKTGLAANVTGGGGLERPIDVTFGQHKDMFITDFGIVKPPGTNIFAVPNTGVIWRVTKR